MRPRIVQTDDQIGFHWVTPAGAATTLRELVVDDDEPDRLVATHIEALDDALIIAAERFGELLGGGRPPRDQQERDGLSELHRVLDLLCFDYAAALDAAGLTADVRAGQIIGTATLFSICARRPLGLLGPAPFDGELDDPALGVVAGFDSSGVNKDAARVEHLDAIERVLTAADRPEADPLAVACALDWLLYDWLMAHRADQDSAEIVMPKRHESDAGLLVRAAAASVAARATVDPGLGVPARQFG